MQYKNLKEAIGIPVDCAQSNFSSYFYVFHWVFSGHQKLNFQDFSGPTGPLEKKVSVEPC